MRIRRWAAIAAAIPASLLVAGYGALSYISGTVLWWLPPENLTVVSWGEDYQRAQMVSLFHPFTDETGVDVDATIYGGGLNEVRSQVASGTIEWDVVDFDLADAAAACREGLLERIDPATLPAAEDGTSAAADFVPGAVGSCWIGSAVYSQIIAYAPGKFPEAPRTAADFFDLARFPGKRGLRDSGPQYNLALALLADGVSPGEVYSLLATEEGAARAFAKLDSIKPSILWWRRPNEPIDMLTRGDVAMTTALNGRVFAAETSGGGIKPIWDGQLYSLDVFGIPRGTSRLERALEFVRYVTSTGPLAEQSRWVPYGPARHSAAVLAGENDKGMAMRPFLPTAPENFGNALLMDPDWWAANGEALQERWTAWRGQ